MAFCANCGANISDQAMQCPNCGHPGPGAARTPATMAAGGGPVSVTGQPLASWGQRFGAALIDGLVVGIPAYVIMLIVGFGLASSTTVRYDQSTGRLVGSTGGLFAGLIGGLLLIFALVVLYRTLLEGNEKGQTVGKMALKIAVKDEATGGSIGYGRAALRYIVVALVGWIPYLGFIAILVDGLFPLWDPKRQTIHDKIAKSVVIRVA